MKNKKLKKPFFASFLEKQINNSEKIKGGAVTSVLVDNVTSALQDTVTKPGYDNVTMKYPSDGDETGEAS
ncbi:MULTISPECIES: microviridin/marinostatin family tricyclic proteinase inhibitor [Chryseobacterium]|uniref:Serine endopeptidase n=1 Tax=Chryseobacterium glaciei TaxID=1685010 RepID=A0A172XYD4_9FLAO|nr:MULTISPECIES: microviridin/marinostatin family tricyclic proteinase inhibitor [Chryseobacterium]ANF51825.1 serine endopeptidase [Chryseobacterium glaciei]AZA51633.1 serine endopeptidase [Chryseobacterium sp. G0201]